MSRIKQWAVMTALFFVGYPAFSLGPHECVLLVNRRSMDSIELANYYAELRHIPAANIIHLDLPPKALESRAVFTPAEFNDFIYDPVRKVLRDRNLIGHVLVWLYSADFPSVISSDPPISLTGITFLHGVVPPSEQIEKGTYASPLFRGPDRADGPTAPPVTFEDFTLRLTTNMPIPSMMIGWTGARGMSVHQIKQQLRASASGDGSHPSASVYFETNDDVRSKARSWQFAPAARELASLGVTAIMATNPPTDRRDLMGVLAGRATINPSTYATMLRPGVYADHLTSLAAYFNNPDQTKLTSWLKLNAAGSSGTVHEPYANWAKFPSARLFAHYANGCTLIESLYQATRSPLQILFVGDPLCNPWMRPPGITLLNMADDENAPIKGKADFVASSWTGFGQVPPTTIFFLDGRPVNQPGTQAQLSMDSERLFDGYHELRAVAYAAETIRHQGFDTRTFFTRNRNRGVELGGYTNRQAVDYYHPVVFQIKAEGSPREAAIIVQERVVAREPYTSNMTISISMVHIGPGPVRFQAVVVYPDNEAVRSAPLLLDIQAMNQPPQIHEINIHTNEQKGLLLSMAASDPENDQLEAIWYNDLIDGNDAPQLAPMDDVAISKWDKQTLELAASSGVVCATFELDRPNLIKEIRTVFRGSSTPIPDHFRAGIVFNYIDENNYMFWGASAHYSAWALIRFRDGRNELVLTRGAPINVETEYDLMMLAIDSGKMALFANNNLMAIADLGFSAGKVGVLSSTHTTFDHLFVSPPSATKSIYTEAPGGLAIPSGSKESLASIVAAVRDVQLTTIKPVVTADQ